MKETLIINFIETVYSYICVFVIFTLMFTIIYVLLQLFTYFKVYIILYKIPARLLKNYIKISQPRLYYILIFC